MNTHCAAFFAALNTHLGFVSYFREIFDKVETVYVIKGGSGTGKSRFMREISACAKDKGYSVEEFLCSSDPTSLDGIIIYELNVAVLDGTAPHIHEPTLIGARERFVDLSVFLDVEGLKEQKTYIEELQGEKIKEYGKIYDYLKILNLYNKMINETLNVAFCESKMDKAIEKICAPLVKGKKGENIVRIRSSVGCNGIVTLDTYEKMGKKRYAVSDTYGLGEVFLKKIFDTTSKSSIRVTVSYSPQYPNKPDALYYPDFDMSFYISSKIKDDEIPINMRRFVSDSVLRPYKAEIRALTRLKNDAIASMNKCFTNIKKLHFELEKIYSSAMDFSEKEKYTKEFIDKLFK